MKKPAILLIVFVILVFVFFFASGVGNGYKNEAPRLEAENAAETVAQQTETAVETQTETTATESSAAETESAEVAASAPDLDITGCDTFTQIVDRKLEPGMGYVNVTIGEEDVLLVSSGTFDNGDGLEAAIDATVFIYENGMPKQIGKVTCGGTAYPLAIKDGLLYSAGGHFVQTSIVEDGRFQLYETNWEEFDEDGSVHYYYESVEGKDEVVSDTNLQNMFQDYESAETIGFTVVVE